MIVFDSVSFFYPGTDVDSQEGEIRAVEDPSDVRAVFTNLSTHIPDGVVSVVGENGIGKSTLLLLAGARLFPAAGRVTIDGVDTRDFKPAREDPAVEERRNRLVSFVYQNMEFETQDSVGHIMETIAASAGEDPGRTAQLVADLREALELDGFLSRRTQELAKGQLQRAIIAFSVLYGSRYVLMDEPVFALEEYQKDRALGFLRDYAHEAGTNFLYTVHNLDLSRKYADSSVLISKNGAAEVGPVEEVLTREKVEAAYQVPFDTLHQRDNLYRDMLNRRLT